MLDSASRTPSTQPAKTNHAKPESQSTASRRNGAEPDLAPCLRPDLKSRAHNLPRPASRFVGREREIDEVKDLLCSPIQAEGRHGAQLVTLTGPGGCGKTRLASEIGCRAVEGFADGVWWADLAPLSDPALVPQAVASALGLPEQPGIPLSETLSDALESSHALLVFDNCEQLSAACAVLSAKLGMVDLLA